MLVNNADLNAAQNFVDLHSSLRREIEAKTLTSGRTKYDENGNSVRMVYNSEYGDGTMVIFYKIKGSQEKLNFKINSQGISVNNVELACSHFNTNSGLDIAKQLVEKLHTGNNSSRRTMAEIQVDDQNLLVSIPFSTHKTESDILSISDAYGKLEALLDGETQAARRTGSSSRIVIKRQGPNLEIAELPTRNKKPQPGFVLNNKNYIAFDGQAARNDNEQQLLLGILSDLISSFEKGKVLAPNLTVEARRNAA